MHPAKSGGCRFLENSRSEPLVDRDGPSRSPSSVWRRHAASCISIPDAYKLWITVRAYSPRGVFVRTKTPVMQDLVSELPRIHYSTHSGE